jgi:hypothetical protein
MNRMVESLRHGDGSYLYAPELDLRNARASIEPAGSSQSDSLRPKWNFDEAKFRDGKGSGEDAF